MICCDTSFLLSFYGRDTHTERAISICRNLGQPLSISALVEFEFFNAVRLSIFRKILSVSEAAVTTSAFERDISTGNLTQVSCNYEAIVSEAGRLSEIYTMSQGYRSFDILHVATASRLQASVFLTFDIRQAILAKAVKLKVKS